MISLEQFSRGIRLLQTAIASLDAPNAESCHKPLLPTSSSVPATKFGAWRLVSVERPGSYEVCSLISRCQLERLSLILEYLELGGVPVGLRATAHQHDPTQSVTTSKGNGTAGAEGFGNTLPAATAIMAAADAACTDDLAGLSTATIGSLHLYHFHILYHQTYYVPVMCFQGVSAGGRPLSLAEMQPDFPAWQDARRQTREMWTFISQTDHPVLQRPWFMLHPCQTATLLTLLMAERGGHNDSRDMPGSVAGVAHNTWECEPLAPPRAAASAALGGAGQRCTDDGGGCCLHTTDHDVAQQLVLEVTSVAQSAVPQSLKVPGEVGIEGLDKERDVPDIDLMPDPVRLDAGAYCPPGSWWEGAATKMMDYRVRELDDAEVLRYMSVWLGLIGPTMGLG